MGSLYYGASDRAINIDDRALAHLKIVISTKLRRQESFTLSWKHHEDDAVGRTTLWVHPSIPLRFVFTEPEPPTLNPRWIEKIMNSANSSGGIQVVDEDVEADN